MIAKSFIFLPLITTGTTGQKEQPPVVPIQGCGLNPIAVKLSDFFIHAEWQKRKDIICHPLLVQAAQHKAERMANENFFEHITPDGIYPNENAKNFGYPLPYKTKENNIESIGAGMRDLEILFEMFLKSPAHYNHITGSTEFFRNQRNLGVGYAEKLGSKYFHYYVILTSE